MTDFDPGRYLTKVGSADYLEVKWRLVWLRETHPDAELDTQLISHPDSDEAIFKCTIKLPSGGSATGWGSETPNDFRDYLEKAETKAIGRALAALGFGTQFTPDHDFGGSSEPSGKFVDTPVTKPKAKEPKSLYPAPTTPASTYVEKQPDDAERARAMKKLHAVAGALGLSHDDLHAIAVGRKKGSLKDLDAPTLLTFSSWLETAPDGKIQELIAAGKAAAS